MKQAYLFAGQAAQFVGMGEQLNADYRTIFEQANEILGFDLRKVMLEGPEDALKQTINTQPAVFLHSYLVWSKYHGDHPSPSALAGHSLGELTALVVGGVISFEDGLSLVKSRAEAMQSACEQNPSTMAAILGMEDHVVEKICANIPEVVVPANYNCPGQLVISGSKEGIDKAIAVCQEQGARRALEISVGGAFHSPLMEPAVEPFAAAVEAISFSDAQIPIYQNVTAEAVTDGDEIKQNIIDQVTSPVRWTQTIQNMIGAGITQFVEIGGKGRILQGMVRKVSRDVDTEVWKEA
jgi:[acyl-carrier-protein] S-malonyltransferase